MGKHGKHRGLVTARAVLLVWLCWSGAAAAQGCRIALSLGLDVSNSVDAQEYRLQTGGLAAALGDRAVVAAFFAIPGQIVALQVFEWSGRRQQAVRQDWVRITSPAVLADFAARLRAQKRGFTAWPTAIGHALRFGAAQMARAPQCRQGKLDISGDGENNDGFAPELAFRAGDAAITINGLVIGARRQSLREYYRENVIRGPGAFVEMARDHADFERAMRRKLVRELSEMQLSGLQP